MKSIQLIIVMLRRGDNVQLVVKPHPREKKLDRYANCKITVDSSNQGISQEILLASAKNQPLCIIGFCSTSLILANLYYNIPIICLGKLGAFEKIPGFGTDISNFIETFSELLIVPNSFQDVEDAIAEIIKRKDKN